MVQRAVVSNMIRITDDVYHIVIKTKHKDAYTYIAFTAYREMINTIKNSNIEKGDRIKIEYHLISKKVGDKYYTNAIIDTIKLLDKKAEQLTIDMDTGEIF